MTTNSTQDERQRLQESAHLRGVVSSIAQAARHLEALTAGIVGVGPAQPRPERLKSSPVFLEDLTNWAEGVTYGINGVLDKALLTHEAKFLCQVSADILSRYDRKLHPEHASYHRLSEVLLLEAFIASPAAVQNALQMLRSLLLEEDPELARLHAALTGGNTPAPA
jgi:hypothetical protein